MPGPDPAGSHAHRTTAGSNMPPAEQLLLNVKNLQAGYGKAEVLHGLT